MFSPLVSWILSSPSSSSSSSTEEEDEEEEESLDIDNTVDESNHKNDILVDDDRHKDKTNIPDDDENDHYLSSCDVEDTIPLALAVPEASPMVTVAFAATDERTIIPAAATAIVTRSKRQRTANYSSIVRQYQRLWTKRDEIELLKGYLDYMKQNKGATNSLQNDVALFYDDIRHKLNIGFNMNQLVEKLRRLKRKHKVALDKGNLGKEVSFKNPHDEAIFEISSKIWANDTDQGDALDLDGGGSGSGGGGDDDLHEVKVKIEQVENGDEMEKMAVKRPRLSEHKDGDERLSEHKDNDDVGTSHIQGFIEETMKSCFSPLIKELLDHAPEGSPKSVELWSGEAGDEEWRKRRVSELEVYLNRLELLQNQIKAKLKELRSGHE